MAEKTVTVYLRGGLGNQLFQYAAGYSKSKSLGAKLVLDGRQLPRGPETISGVSHWPEQISEFEHGAAEVLEHVEKVSLLARYKQVERSLGDQFPSWLSKFGIYANEKNSSVEDFSSIRNSNVSINAYCNSPLYFSDYADEIRGRIRNLVNPSQNFLDDRDTVNRVGPVALHLRLGDYKNLSSIYGKFDVEYFSKALSLAERIDSSRPVWLFSDEPELAYELLKSTVKNLHIAPLSPTLSNLETLLLMSECKGLIASNSTFSWWAGYLMDQTHPVIFPRPFFSSSTLPEPKSMLLEAWIQLGRKLSNV
jgi:hypothetical protein